MARVFSGDRQIGWGADCRRHKNTADVRPGVCKKQITYGGKSVPELSDDACQKVLKQWLIAGLDIPKDSDVGRTTHRDLPDPRYYSTAVTHAQLQERLDAKLAELGDAF